MSRQTLPFIISDEKQIDDYTLTDYTKRQINGVMTLGLTPEGEKKLFWSNRPGLATFTDLGVNAQVDGLFWWEAQEVLVAVCGGRVFFVGSTGTVNEKTGTATMEVAARPSFADVDGTELFIASGGRIGVYQSGAANDGAYIGDADAPTNVTHLGTLNKSLIALKANTDRFYWSNVNAPDVWTSDFASAETSTDRALALHVMNSEIIIAGSDSMETFRDSGVTFVRELQGFLQVGIHAPSSFAKVDTSYYWLNDSREVVRRAGRQYEVVSNPYAKYIKDLSVASDAVGYYLQVDGKNFYVIQFPTADTTLVYDIVLDRWCEWGAWTGAAYTKMLANNYAYCKRWGASYAGATAGGLIYNISYANPDDLGTIIRGMIRTDRVNYGATDKKKFSSKLIFTFKKSEVSDTTAANLTLRYRDDGLKVWSSDLTIPVEFAASTDFTTEIRRMGSYFNRQYEIAFTEDTDVMLVSVEEEVDLGG